MPDGVRTSTVVDEVTEKNRFDTYKLMISCFLFDSYLLTYPDIHRFNNFPSPSLPVPQPLRASRNKGPIKQLLEEIEDYYGKYR